MSDVYLPDEKKAHLDFPVISEIAKRWSPYRYQPKSVAPALIEQCFEAARWAASSYNEQPWFFIIAFREDKAKFAKALECLVEANQTWAKDAGVLLLTVTSDNFAKNNKPNRVSLHDLGQAAAHFSLQATALGLSVHQMSGIDQDIVRGHYRIPQGFTPQTAIAIGYAAEETLPGQESLEPRDKAERSRKEIKNFVFQDTWDQSWK